MSGIRMGLRARLVVAIAGLALLGAACDLQQPVADAPDAATDDAEGVAGRDGDAPAPPVVGKRSGPFECDGVDVAPGDDLAAVAEQRPAGTTFCIRSGVHRVGEVLAQTGDQFIGESGAVLNGARDVSADVADWRRSGGAWVLGGQTQQSQPLRVCHHAAKGCIEGAGAGPHPNQYNEELFADNRRLQHVASKRQLGPGKWFFDYRANQIWLGEDPAGLGQIEATVYRGAIGSARATDVVIDNLVIEKYGSLPGRGAVGGWDPSTRDKTRDFRWQFRNITGRLNHGAAVLMMEGDRLENCKLTHNGQLGFKAFGDRPANGQAKPRDFDQRVIVRNCEIAHNNQLDYRAGWEAGGFKIGQMPAGSVVENVWSHDNRGPGMWWDSFNRNVVVRSNLVEDNLGEGIFYEISHGDTRIYWNRLRNNGEQADKYSSKGIFLSNAEGVEVFGNAVDGSNMAIHIRETGGRRPATRDIKVYDNDFKPADTSSCNGVGTFRGATAAASAGAGNEFRGNLWRLPSKGAAILCWGDGQRSRMSVAEAPVADDVTTSGSPKLPSDAQPFENDTFGAQ